MINSNDITPAMLTRLRDSAVALSGSPYDPHPSVLLGRSDGVIKLSHASTSCARGERAHHWRGINQPGLLLPLLVLVAGLCLALSSATLATILYTVILLLSISAYRRSHSLAARAGADKQEYINLVVPSEYTEPYTLIAEPAGWDWDLLEHISYSGFVRSMARALMARNEPSERAFWEKQHTLIVDAIRSSAPSD